MDEFGLIRVLQKELEVGEPAGVELGIGDDAAVLSSKGKLVWSIDDSVESVHFDLNWLTPKQAAHRAVHAAASDLAAMGARPVAALCSIQCPKGFGATKVRELAKGQRGASEQLGLPIVGGNMTRGTCLRFTTTVLGSARTPITRHGAKDGDEIWVAGSIGEAAAGLQALQQELNKGGSIGEPAERRAMNHCVRAWRVPTARLEDGLRLARSATALIDLSDGLVGDAGHIAEASGVSLILEERLLRASLSAALSRLCARLDRDPLQLALYGGEDYALLATGPATRRPSGVQVIGRVASGKSRVVLLDASGRKHALRRGFDHFRG